MSDNNLCSHTAQVPRPFKTKKLGKIPYYALELAKNEIVDWFNSQSVQTTDEKKRKIYEKYADKVFNCGNDFIVQKAGKYVRASRMYCKNEFCPICGQKDSQLHKKRMSRAADRLLWSPGLGYLVFTIPAAISEKFPNKEQINRLSEWAFSIANLIFDAPGAMLRTHLMGDEPGKLHIHFNVLFPILSDTGIKEKNDLLNMRRLWATVLNEEFGLNLKTSVVSYNFQYSEGKKLHKIKYVLRPVITADRFLTLDDEKRCRIVDLKGWHNTRWFGKLANSQYKKYLESKGVEIKQKPDQVCPVNGEKYKFVGIVSKYNLKDGYIRFVEGGENRSCQVRPLDENNFVDWETYLCLKEKGG